MTYQCDINVTTYFVSLKKKQSGISVLTILLFFYI